MPSLPYSRKRYYLSGMDWIIGALNGYMVSTKVAGNHSSLVVRLSGEISEAILREKLNHISTALPLLSGRLKRDFANLAPYWQPAKPNFDPGFPLEIIHSASDDDIRKLLVERLNRPFQNENEHLAFILLRMKGVDSLVMTFDHRVLDARGAELFLNLLSGEDELPSSDLLKQIKTVDAPELRDWSAKFAAGRDVQRKIINMTKNAGCHVLMNGRVGRSIKPPELSCSFHKFTPSETLEIESESERVAGYMMETVYLLAVSALAVHRVSAPKNKEWFFVPVPIDVRRKTDCGARKMLFNHFSFLFFHFEVSPESTIESLAREIRGQLHAQIAEEFPEKMMASAYLGRIFPNCLMRQFMRLPFNGKMATFVFANVGAGDPPENILGKGVESIQHMPRIPSPPGLGVFFSRYAGGLNFTLTADDSNLSLDLSSGVFQGIIESLLEKKAN